MKKIIIISIAFFLSGCNTSIPKEKPIKPSPLSFTLSSINSVEEYAKLLDNKIDTTFASEFLPADIITIHNHSDSTIFVPNMKGGLATNPCEYYSKSKNKWCTTIVCWSNLFQYKRIASRNSCSFIFNGGHYVTNTNIDSILCGVYFQFDSLGTNKYRLKGKSFRKGNKFFTNEFEIQKR